MVKIRHNELCQKVAELCTSCDRRLTDIEAIHPVRGDIAKSANSVNLQTFTKFLQTFLGRISNFCQLA